MQHPFSLHKPSSLCRYAWGGVLLYMLTWSAQAKPIAPEKWYQIRTHHFNILFQGHIHREANRMANTLEHYYPFVSKTLQAAPGKCPLILDTRRAHSNGYTNFGPSRMRIYTFPAQDYSYSGDGIDWLSGVSIHEFRHVVQYTKLAQHGLGEVAMELGSPLLIPMVGHIAVPRWMLEGDAVGTETVLTNSGRGRLPYFSTLYRASLLERGGFSYYKQLCGSYKHKMPGPYKLGYYLTTHLRRKYGAQSLADVLWYITWGVPLPLAVQLSTGKGLLAIYRETNQELKALWEQQLEGLSFTPAECLHRHKKDSYVDYYAPQPYHRGGIVALKGGASFLGHLVWVDDQKREKKLCTPRLIEPEVGFSMAKDRIVWAEEVAYPFKLKKKNVDIWSENTTDTWEATYSYSVIRCYDLSTRRQTTLTPKGRYGTAALSPDAAKVVAVESDRSYNHAIVTLDANTGQVLRRFPNPENHFYRTPQWANDGRHIVTIKVQNPTSSIVIIDTQTSETRELTLHPREQISKPVMYGKYVFYSSSFSGIDNIYAIDLSTSQRYQVTSRKYGAYHPAVSSEGHWLLFNDFTADGMQAVKMRLDPAKWIPIEQVEDRSVYYHAPLVTQEAGEDIVPQIPDKEYPVERYHTWKHLINFCGWHFDPSFGPVGQDATDLTCQVDLILKFQDVMNTFDLKPAYKHDLKENMGRLALLAMYTGGYSVLSAKPSLIRDHKKGITTEKALSLEAKLPMLIEQGAFDYTFVLSTTTDLYERSRATWSTQKYKLELARHSRQAHRDSHYPWKQGVNITYKHTPYDSEVQGQQWITDCSLNFPGVLPNHSLRLFGQWDCSQSQQFALFDQWLQHRDKPQNISTTLHEYNTLHGKVHYTFPIWYPDIHIMPIAYIKKVDFFGFYEQIYYPDSPKKEIRQHWGADLIFNLWPIPTFAEFYGHSFVLSVGYQYRADEFFKDQEGKSRWASRFSFKMLV